MTNGVAVSLLNTQLLDPVPLVREQLQDAAIAHQVQAADDDEPRLRRVQEVRDLPTLRPRAVGTLAGRLRPAAPAGQWSSRR